MINLQAIVEGIHEDIKNFVGHNQVANCYSRWSAPINDDDDPTITISQCGSSRAVDLRYALIQFKLEGILLTTNMHIYAKWLVHAYDPEFKVDIQNPFSFERLEYWILCEALDGLKRGWSGREEKWIPIIKRQRLPSIETQLKLEFANG